MLIPQNKLILVNTWLAHTNEVVWNTKNGAFPLDILWAQRFLIDPNDRSSGPTKKRLQTQAKAESYAKSAKDPYFSTYGGKIFVSPR